MSKLLEITGDDIAELGDTDLRSLIGLLCEADYRLAGLSTKGITWGGHQDAKDGGLDVVVCGIVQPPATSFIPKSCTGFQVKRSNMPRAKILKEMRPDNVLRPSIKQLIQEEGAYIIVSLNGSVADTALNDRRNAMAEAVAGEDNHENLHLDFFDRGRVATWVRNHPSLIIWVRNKIGRPVKGWRPYANWANTPGGLEEGYLLDDGLRLHDWENPSEQGLSVEQGIDRLRSILAKPKAAVRLTGLSGVGKTRLVQALFDTRIGKQNLNPFHAIYTDISHGPEPAPEILASQLVSDWAVAILIVDNCPPELHRRLAQMCKSAQSTISLLTVEYDIRDDVPEEKTSIYRLEPASGDLIIKLIANRFEYIGRVNARTIAEFSGGNARVAIALANTIRRGETLSDFKEEELFKRLFWQRHDPDENLLSSAQVCALVYSFQGEDVTSDQSELRFLGSLIGKSGQDIYRDAVLLKQRGLVQSRSIWRAVLPHAIANRLAKQALELISQQILVDAFLAESSERLIKSFTRRLSYLHDSEIAVNIAEAWLEPDGWIGKSINNLNHFGASILQNIAPVSPKAVLAAIEHAANGYSGGKFTSRRNPHYATFVRLLRHLAYDSALFERSADLIVRFTLTEDMNENHDPIRDKLKSLFYIQLSGTHATVEARAATIQKLLDSDELANQELGLFLLDAPLETWHFHSSHKFDFGARPRNFGYSPKTPEEVTHWYGTFINICLNMALSDQNHAQKAKKLLADHLRGLWVNVEMFETIEQCATALLGKGAWNEGWMAIRSVIRLDSKDLKQEEKERLFSLERTLKPEDLLEEVRAYVLSDPRAAYNLEDDFDEEGEESGYEAWRAHGKLLADTARELGLEVADNADILQKLLPELVSVQNPRLFDFGKGLAEGSGNKQKVFTALRNALKVTDHEQHQIGIFLGFLFYLMESETDLFNTLMNQCIYDEVLGEHFPTLQIALLPNQYGLERLHKALDLGKAPIQTFQQLAYGRSHESLTDNELADFLAKILTKDGGYGVVVEVLKMRFYRNQKKPHEYAESLIKVAQEVLEEYTFEWEPGNRNNDDHALTIIATAACIGQPKESDTAKILIGNLAEAVLINTIFTSYYKRLLKKLAELQPRIFLNEFLDRESPKRHRRSRFLWGSFHQCENPLNKISDGEIIKWCDEAPLSRYAIAIVAVDTFGRSNDSEKHEWRSITYEILNRAPNLDLVLGRLSEMLTPSSWMGSLVNILERYCALLRDLYEHENPEVVAWAKRNYAKLQQKIVIEREEEQTRNRAENERFE